MFQKLKVPIVGVVQNMTTFVCPKCQHSLSLYGHGTEVLASELGNDNILTCDYRIIHIFNVLTVYQVQHTHLMTLYFSATMD
jgi:Mrp family chromosome partitioning ATPase